MTWVMKSDDQPAESIAPNVHLAKGYTLVTHLVTKASTLGGGKLMKDLALPLVVV